MCMRRRLKNADDSSSISLGRREADPGRGPRAFRGSFLTLFIGGLRQNPPCRTFVALAARYDGFAGTAAAFHRTSLHEVYPCNRRRLAASGALQVDFPSGGARCHGGCLPLEAVSSIALPLRMTETEIRRRREADAPGRSASGYRVTDFYIDGGSYGTQIPAEICTGCGRTVRSGTESSPCRGARVRCFAAPAIAQSAPPCRHRVSVSAGGLRPLLRRFYHKKFNSQRPPS